MIIDNFDIISKVLKFSDPNEFYYITIFQRKKDGNNNINASSGRRLIKSYCIYSLEELFDLKDKIMELCRNNNARAYINPNVRNANQVALECSKRYIDLVQTNRAYQGNRIWDSVCGSCKAYNHKALWIVDIDKLELLDRIYTIILSCRHNEEIDYRIFVVPTVHGYHIICNGFDVNQFKEKLKMAMIEPIDIHKDNPTLLYYEI